MFMLLLCCCCCFSFCGSTIFIAIKDFIVSQGSTVSAFVCWKTGRHNLSTIFLVSNISVSEERIKFFKILGNAGILQKQVNTRFRISDESVLAHPLFLLDMDCKASAEILQKVRVAQFLTKNGLHFFSRQMK